MNIKKLASRRQQSNQNRHYVSLVLGLISAITLAQSNDTLNFKCTCMDGSKQEVSRKVFYKSTNDFTHVVNFSNENTSNDTLIINNSKVYLRSIDEQNVLFDFENSKFKSIVYSQSGLGLKVYYVGKRKWNKSYYYQIGFDSFATHTPFISSLTIDKNFDILSFIYYDSNRRYNCTKR